MFKHPLIEIFKTFSDEQLDELDKLLNSPFFNSSSDIIKLFEQLRRYFPLFNQEELTKRKLYENVISEKRNYNDGTMRDLLSKLLKLTKLYISVSQFLKNENEKYNYLNKELIKSGLYKIYFNSSKKENKIIKNLKIDGNYFYHKWLQKSYMYNYEFLINSKSHKKNIVKNIQLQNESAIYLTLHYVSELLCAYANDLAYNINFDIEGNISILENLIKCIDLAKLKKLVIKNKNEYCFYFDLYFSLILMLKKPNDINNYFAYKEKLNKCSMKLSHNENTFHYSNLIRYCLREDLQNYSKEFGLLSELLLNYQIFLSKELYKNDKTEYLSNNLYKNILFSSLRQNKIEWAYNFVNDYYKILEPAQSKNLYYLGLAYIEEAIKNNENSLILLNNINKNNFPFLYDIYNLKMKLFYELEQFENLRSTIHGFEELMKKKVLSKERKEKYRNFIKIIKILILFKEKNKKFDFIGLQYNLDKKIDYSNLKWAKDKLNNIENKNISISHYL